LNTQSSKISEEWFKDKNSKDIPDSSITPYEARVDFSE
jgi:hypothetical protein